MQCMTFEKIDGTVPILQDPSSKFNHQEHVHTEKMSKGGVMVRASRHLSFVFSFLRS